MIHHLTLYARKPAKTRAFYQGVLGMRLVKHTVSPDDPYTRMMIFGDRRGSPGSLLCALFYPRCSKAVTGVGGTAQVSLAIPKGSSSFWRERLARSRVRWRKESGPLAFFDPDGTPLRLVESETAWVYDERSEVEQAVALRGVHRVRVCVSQKGSGFWHNFPQVECEVSAAQAVPGHGAVHHIAFLSDGESEFDRVYYHSSYQYSPDGHLCEFATVRPGVLCDEPEQSLGERFCLPPWYESRREEIERVLGDEF